MNELEWIHSDRLNGLSSKTRSGLSFSRTLVVLSCFDRHGEESSHWNTSEQSRIFKPCLIEIREQVQYILDYKHHFRSTATHKVRNIRLCLRAETGHDLQSRLLYIRDQWFWFYAAFILSAHLHPCPPLYWSVICHRFVFKQTLRYLNLTFTFFLS